MKRPPSTLAPSASPTTCPRLSGRICKSKRSYECHVADQLADAIAARQDALAAWRAVDDQLKQGESLRWLSLLHWYVGQNTEAEEFARDALDVLSNLDPGPQMAWSCSNLAQLRMLAWDAEAAIIWGNRAIVLAERHGEMAARVHALNNVGAAMLQAGDDGGWAMLEQSLALALKADLEEHAARAFTNLSWHAVERYLFARADEYLARGFTYCRERDLDSWRFNMLGWQAIAHFYRGRWREATSSVQEVLRHPNISVTSRINPLVILGRMRARLGDPEVWSVLDEAMALAGRTDELPRIGPVHLARAEAAWLAGDLDRTEEEARAALDLAVRRGHRWLAGGLASWLWRIGRLDEFPADLPEPIACQIAGDWAAAAAAWDALDCPYEAAMARLDGDEQALRAALATFEGLGARPAAALAARRLREIGARIIPRGPRRSTRTNPANLTERQLEILTLVAEGRTNGEIADRLFLSPKTVEHHVAAVFTKLDVDSRTEVADAASRLGFAFQRRGPSRPD